MSSTFLGPGPARSNVLSPMCLMTASGRWNTPFLVSEAVARSSSRRRLQGRSCPRPPAETTWTKSGPALKNAIPFVGGPPCGFTSIIFAITPGS